MSRPETGKMRFGDDWSGVFFRGDYAFFLAQILRETLENIDSDNEGVVHIMHLSALRGLLSDLESANEHNGLEPQQMKSFDECVIPKGESK